MNYTEDQLRELELHAHVRTARAVAFDATLASNLSIALPATTAPHRQPVPVSVKPSPAGVKSQPIAIVARPEIAMLDWAGLAQSVAACHACALCKQRRHAVLGGGTTAGPWMVVGEAPGEDEDKQGEPFLGASGQLLDAMLKALGLARGRDVYLTTAVKCRPPGNRTPVSEEIAACAPYLDRQIALVKPALILALGRTAALRLTGGEGSMAELRGRVHVYRGMPLVITYQLSYLLRTPTEKLKVWEDLLFARQSLRLPAAG